MIFVEKKTQINGLYEKKVKTSNDDIAGNGRAKVYQYFSITNEFLGEKKNFPLNFFFFFRAVGFMRCYLLHSLQNFVSNGGYYLTS